jgi:hypothetical protein
VKCLDDVSRFLIRALFSNAPPHFVSGVMACPFQSSPARRARRRLDC